MSFVLVLVCTTAFVWVLKTPLLKCPVAFYVLAMLLNVLYVSSAFTTYPEAMRQTLFLLMQKCTLSLAVFTVVMFIGAFRKDSVVSLALRPVRAELSILACVLALGHMVMYLMSFAPRLLNGSAIDSGFLLFFATAIALMALLLILGATSFKGVKRRMDATAWKRLQKMGVRLLRAGVRAPCEHSVACGASSRRYGEDEHRCLYGSVRSVRGVADSSSYERSKD